MSARAGIAAIFAGAGAYVLLKATASAAPEAQVIYVSKPASGGGNAPLSAFAALIGGILDASNGQPIFGGSTGGGDAMPQVIQAALQTSGAPTSSAPIGGGTSIGNRLKSDLMRSFGLTGFQAAGVVGNLHYESGGFSQMQEAAPMIPGSAGGWGYAQWTGSRRRQFEAWAAERGLGFSSYEANWGFLHHELANTSESRVIPMLRATTSLEQATRVFSDVFERPGIVRMESRIAAARKYA